MAAVAAATWPGPMSATDGDLASGSEEDEGGGRGPKHESGRRWQLLQRFLSSYEPTTPCSRRSNRPEQINLILLRPFCYLLNLGVAKSTNQQQVYGNPAATSTLIFDKGIYVGSNTFALPSEQVGPPKPTIARRGRERKGREERFLDAALLPVRPCACAAATASSSPRPRFACFFSGSDTTSSLDATGEAASIVSATTDAGRHASRRPHPHRQKPLALVTASRTPRICSAHCQPPPPPPRPSQPAVTVARPPLCGSWGAASTWPPTKGARRSPWTRR